MNFLPPSPCLSGEFDQMEVDNFVEESLKMSQFKHVHVMGLIGVCLDAGSAPYIIMPYMANGSLLKWLKRERKNIVLLDETDEDEVIYIFFPVCMSAIATVCLVVGGDSQATDGHVFSDSQWNGVSGSGEIHP